MQASPPLKFLFILNKGSGKDDTDWQTLIRKYFETLSHTAELYDLPDSCCVGDIEQQIKATVPNRVVAVGGDGTVKLVAQCCMNLNLPLGILPAGSANGLAKELKIPTTAQQALTTAVQGTVCRIHLTKVNDELCIHLADIGFNAYVVHKFENYEGRGMWGYLRAAWVVLRSHRRMQAQLQINGEQKQEKAAMIVIANATTYGSGAKINPKGRLDDQLFEVVVVRKVSFKEIFKMVFTHQPYDPVKTVVYQTASVQLRSKKGVHFQVDGEYLGKVKEVNAVIMQDTLEVVVPE